MDSGDGSNRTARRSARVGKIRNDELEIGGLTIRDQAEE
jgi:hypothetical protein